MRPTNPRYYNNEVFIKLMVYNYAVDPKDYSVASGTCGAKVYS